MKDRSGALASAEVEQGRSEQLTDATRNKVIEVADLLRHQAPETPLTQGSIHLLVRQLTSGADVRNFETVLRALPEIGPGETGGAYGDRVLAGVRR